MALDDLLMSIFVTYSLHICFLHPQKFSFLAYYTYYLLHYIYTIIFTTDGLVMRSLYTGGLYWALAFLDGAGNTW